MDTVDWSILEIVLYPLFVLSCPTLCRVPLSLPGPAYLYQIGLLGTFKLFIFLEISLPRVGERGKGKHREGEGEGLGGLEIVLIIQFYNIWSDVTHFKT